MKHWYLIHTRPREDERAEANLARQGYRVFLPRVHLRKRRRHGMATVTESLFPRYLFIELDDLAENWAPIRSTRGVASLVRFGGEATTVPQQVVDAVRARTDDGQSVDLTSSSDYRRNERVRIIDGPFRELEGLFVTRSGEERVVVLLNLMYKHQEVRLPERAIARA